MEGRKRRRGEFSRAHLEVVEQVWRIRLGLAIAKQAWDYCWGWALLVLREHGGWPQMWVHVQSQCPISILEFLFGFGLVLQGAKKDGFAIWRAFELAGPSLERWSWVSERDQKSQFWKICLAGVDRGGCCCNAGLLLQGLGNEGLIWGKFIGVLWIWFKRRSYSM